MPQFEDSVHLGAPFPLWVIPLSTSSLAALPHAMVDLGPLLLLLALLVIAVLRPEHLDFPGRPAFVAAPSQPVLEEIVPRHWFCN